MVHRAEEIARDWSPLEAETLPANESQLQDCCLIKLGSLYVYILKDITSVKHFPGLILFCWFRFPFAADLERYRHLTLKETCAPGGVPAISAGQCHGCCKAKSFRSKC